jgi:hypothetical protein
MSLQGRGSRWAELESQADDPEVQAIIAEAIEDEMIRVVSDGKGGIRIVPLEDDEDGGPARAAGDQDSHKPIRRRRFARTDPGTSRCQPHAGGVRSGNESSPAPTGGTPRRRPWVKPPVAPQGPGPAGPPGKPEPPLRSFKRPAGDPDRSGPVGR